MVMCVFKMIRDGVNGALDAADDLQNWSFGFPTRCARQMGANYAIADKFLTGTLRIMLPTPL